MRKGSEATKLSSVFASDEAFKDAGNQSLQYKNPKKGKATSASTTGATNSSQKLSNTLIFACPVSLTQ